MPMSRYEIRNEYSLADPELYRAADKDDPEALLEGVAMAGLVGVLRQLGDLAEFAAEVFHDLHEEVMATASRGHGLMIRVQQLESEVPFIEKAFLSQTDHSPYFYNAGVDWHSNLRLEQNLVTQGDLPRFIMDSYEECRGPPRLFLLDKFDVAGAGACLKRYTDPSFFKVETSGMSRADVHREKFRKAKKRGPRWRNGENPEVLSASHAKLHQLFMEERVGNVVDNPARRVKLKRRLNGFTFDSVTGRGYMEKLLKTPSPEHQVLHEVNVSSSPLMLPTNDYDESRLEVPEVRRADTDIEGVERKGSVSSPGREESMSTYESNETSKYDVTCEAQSSYHGMVTDDISSTSESLTSEKNIASDGAHKTEGSLTGYQSDEIASEIDNYVDAPSTMESEMDTDSELKVKSDFTFSFIRSQPLISDAKEDSNPTRSSDSQSTGESIISDDGNNSLKKGTSGFSSSDSPSTSAEDPHSETNLEKGLASADIHEIDIVDTSTHQTITDVELFADPQSLSLVPDYTCTSTDAFSNRRSGFEQLPSGLGITDAQGTLTLSSPGVVERDWMERPQLNEAASVSDDEERKTEMFTDPPYSHSNSGFTSQWGEGSQRSVAEEHARQNGENIPLLYTTAGNSYHADSSTGISADLLHEGECNPEDLNPVENIASTLNNTGTPEMIPLENPILCNIDEEVLEFPENVSYDCPDVDQGGDNFKSASWEVEKQSKASLAGSHIVGAEEDYSNGSISNQISSETSILPHVEKPLYWTETVLDTHGRNVVPEEDSIVNATPTFGTLKYSEVVGSQAPEMTDELNLYESAALESSRGSPENLEEPAGPSDSVAYEKITTDTSSTEAEVDETMGPADAKLQNEIHVKLDEFDADQVETVDMVSTTAALSDNANRSDVCLPVNPDKCLAEHTPCPEDAGMGELGDNANYLSETQKKPSLVEEVNENKAILSEPNKHLNLEESDIVRDLNLPSDADHGLELVDSTSIQPAMEQSSFDTEQETLQKSGFVNHVSSDSSLPMFANTKDLTFQEEIELPSNQHDEESQGAGEQETLQKRGFLNHVSSDSSLPMFANTKDLTFQEEIELPSNQHDEEVLGAREINPGLSNLLPINHQQTLDHDDHNGDNDSALPFSLFNHASPPFPLELPGLYNDKSDFSGRTKVPVHSIFPHHKFSETSQPNQDELPPLPPLPPVQWRMGKLQHASSISERETMKQELFPLINSSSTTSTDALSPATEEMNHSLVQMAPETSSNDKKVEHSMSNLEAGTAHELTDPQQETENEPRQMSTPTNEGLVLDETNHSRIQIDHETATKEEEDCSSSVEASAMNETIDLRAKSENEQQQPMAPSTESSSFEEMNFSLVQTNPEDASERENIQQRSSSLEAGPMSDKVDVPVKIENEQQKPVVSFSVSESKLSADEDGVPNSKTKPPRTRDPLIDEVAAIDKSRLKRVTDRVLPEIQKVDERDSLLQQIRTKSFNLKPAVASRPSIRGPNTNLRVAAILEKANAIRQALAGSDEDDDDNWSDS